MHGGGGGGYAGGGEGSYGEAGGGIVDLDVVEVVVAVARCARGGVVVAEGYDAAGAGVAVEVYGVLNMGGGHAVGNILQGDEGGAFHHAHLKAVGGAGGVVAEGELEAIERSAHGRQAVVAVAIEAQGVIAAVGVGAAVVDSGHVGTRGVGGVGEGVVPAVGEEAGDGGSRGGVGVEVLGEGYGSLVAVGAQGDGGRPNRGVAGAADAASLDAVVGVGGEAGEVADGVGHGYGVAAILNLDGGGVAAGEQEVGAGVADGGDANRGRHAGGQEVDGDVVEVDVAVVVGAAYIIVVEGDAAVGTVVVVEVEGVAFHRGGELGLVERVEDVAVVENADFESVGARRGGHPEGQHERVDGSGEFGQGIVCPAAQAVAIEAVVAVVFDCGGSGGVVYHGVVGAGGVHGGRSQHDGVVAVGSKAGGGSGGGGVVLEVVGPRQVGDGSAGRAEDFGGEFGGVAVAEGSHADGVGGAGVEIAYGEYRVGDLIGVVVE